MANLDGIRFYGDTTVDDIITENVISFLQWGFLEIGGFFNINSGTVDALGNDMSRLYPIEGYTNAYRGLAHDWVWEKNVPLHYSGGSQPNQITGIIVNSVVYPTGTSVGGTNYYIDYSRGQVVFDSPLAGNPSVQVPRSERAVHVYRNDGQEYQHVVSNWVNRTASGNITDYRYKAYLPAVFIGTDGWSTISGYNMGERAKWAEAKLEFLVVAANSYECKKIADALYMMETKPLVFYNPDTAPKPLNYSGSLVNENATYPALVSGYKYGPDGATSVFMENARINKIKNSSLPIYQTRVNIGLECIVYP